MKKKFGEAPETAGRFVIRSMRINIRDALISSGMERVECSHDSGDGKYSERWTNGTDIVLLHWNGGSL